jgi:predicted membrane channel-forming protein YqfA (hemolysin III family)
MESPLKAYFADPFGRKYIVVTIGVILYIIAAVYYIVRRQRDRTRNLREAHMVSPDKCVGRAEKGVNRCVLVLET